MARQYFSLVTLENGVWAVQFGDYSEAVVKQERRDSFQDLHKAEWRIITTNGTNKAITEAVEALNREQNAINLYKRLELFAKLSRTDQLDEGTDILSALVNLVDTARENPGMFNRKVNERGEYTGDRMTQAEREKDVVDFICGHCQFQHV